MCRFAGRPCQRLLASNFNRIAFNGFPFTLFSRSVYICACASATRALHWPSGVSLVCLQIDIVCRQQTVCNLLLMYFKSISQTDFRKRFSRLRLGPGNVLRIFDDGLDVMIGRRSIENSKCVAENHFAIHLRHAAHWKMHSIPLGTRGISFLHAFEEFHSMRGSAAPRCGTHELPTHKFRI